MHAFLSSADFFEIKFFKKNLPELPSECQTVWIQIRPDDSSSLIWVRTVYKGCQQVTLAVKDLLKLPVSVYYFHHPESNSCLKEIIYSCNCRKQRLSVVLTFLIFSSPELKAHVELIVYRSIRRPSVRSSVRASVNIFKLEYLSNQWANCNQILSEASLGWGIDCIRFWTR